MPYLDLTIYTAKETRVDGEQFTREVLEDSLSILAPDLPIYKKTQLRALWIVLLNVARKPKAIFLYSRSKQEKHPEFTANPRGLSNNSIRSVIDTLAKANYIEHTKGESRYDKEKDTWSYESKMSSFKATPVLLGLISNLGLAVEDHPDEIHSMFPNGLVELFEPNIYKWDVIRHRKKRTYTGKQIPYKPNDFTKAVNKEMEDYCRFLNEADIVFKGERYKDIQLTRKFRRHSWSNPFIFGGRTGGYWNEIPKEDYQELTINREAIVEIDYPYSQTNMVYHMVTGKFLEPDDGYDAYQIVGCETKYRSVIKVIINLMYGNSERGVTKAVTDRINENAKKGKKEDLETKQLHLELREELTTNPKGSANWQPLYQAIQKKHEPIKHMFFLPPAIAQIGAWYETHMVFAVAINATRLGCVTITKHDAFLVGQSNEELIKDYRYTTGLIPEIQELVPRIRNWKEAQEFLYNLMR